MLQIPSTVLIWLGNQIKITFYVFEHIIHSFSSPDPLIWIPKVTHQPLQQRSSCDCIVSCVCGASHDSRNDYWDLNCREQGVQSENNNSNICVRIKPFLFEQTLLPKRLCIFWFGSWSHWLFMVLHVLQSVYWAALNTTEGLIRG